MHPHPPPPPHKNNILGGPTFLDLEISWYLISSQLCVRGDPLGEGGGGCFCVIFFYSKNGILMNL